ncbi:MAG: phosphatidate cytidylyltransferase [Thermodesulfovibrionia bacterium]|nr:phosphatidate cytidylyltransferase [Thermodesulfovibrionia bacterium]
MQDTVKKPFDLKRLVVAFFVIPLLVLFIQYGRHYPDFFLLLLLVSLIALREFHAMYKVPLTLSIPALIAGALLFFVICFYPYMIIETMFFCFIALLLIRLFAVASPAGAMSGIGPVATGYLYILWFMGFQWLLRSDAYGRYNIFLLYGSVWLADSTAYYVGTYLGKHKLCPSLSPNKTYEGAAGSIVGGIAGALIITSIFGFEDLTVFTVVIIGAVLGSVTIFGDLIESMFKRDAGVKDSSSLFPGHGGVLDKLDGVLVAGPVLYFLLGFI